MSTGAAQVALRDTTLAITVPVSNRSSVAWLPEEGWGIGYHLFDADTGTLVVDGERAPLHLEAGESRDIALTVALPPEPGEYSIFVSPVQEHVAWQYDRGEKFLLIDVTVADDSTATLLQWRTSTLRAVRTRGLRRSFGRAFSMPFQSIWCNWSLIRTLVRRDVLSRYTGSFGGSLWAVLNPLLLMLTYFFVFGIVMGTKFPGDSSRTGFALYFLAGMLPWLAFNEAAARAPFIMVEHRNFIRKLVFPIETLPINLVVSGLVTEFFGLILFAIALFVIRGSVPATAIYLPLVILPQVMLTAGLAWFLAALGVFVRDLGQVIGYLLTMLMFMTPIFYPEESLPKFVGGLLKKNPLYVLVHAYRAVLLESTAPDWHALGWFAVASGIIFIGGYAWFHKLRRSFADLI